MGLRSYLLRTAFAGDGKVPASVLLEESLRFTLVEGMDTAAGETTNRTLAHKWDSAGACVARVGS
jgi:hypothetical protein